MFAGLRQTQTKFKNISNMDMIFIQISLVCNGLIFVFCFQSWTGVGTFVPGKILRIQLFGDEFGKTDERDQFDMDGHSSA